VAVIVVSCSSHPVAPVNTDPEGIALHGYDPVAYFDRGAAVPGDPGIESSWRGATWRFASEEHREAFVRDPDKYAPRYGGYCAYAVAQDTTADIDPTVWAIVDGRLYLNLDASIGRKWEKDRARYIEQADEHWPGLIEAGEAAEDAL
jgi:hypothetical protein